MKRLAILISSCISCICITACSSSSSITGSYFNNYTAGKIDGEYKMSGTAHVSDTLPIFYVEALESTSISIYGELKNITGSGDVQLVYVDSNDKATVLLDGSVSDGGTLTVGTSVSFDEGAGRLEFRGDHVKFKMKLTLTNIDWEKFDYFGSGGSSKDEREDRQRISDNQKERRLNKISVSYTAGDEEHTVFTTDLDQAERMNVKLKVTVVSDDDNGSMTFNGFHLFYRTEDGKTIDVVEHKERDFAMGGFEWQDRFEQEIELPEGTSQLIFISRDGENYKITLDIKTSILE